MESVCGLGGKAVISKAACAIWAILRFSGETWLLAPGVMGTTSTPVLDWAEPVLDQRQTLEWHPEAAQVPARLSLTPYQEEA